MIVSESAFKSERFRFACADLAVATEIAINGVPEVRGTIERFSRRSCWIWHRASLATPFQTLRRRATPTLARLLEQGAVLRTQQEPVRYMARPWTDASAELLRRLGSAAETVEAELGRLQQPESPRAIWALPSRYTVLETARSFITDTDISIFASIWDDEMAELSPDLESAARRGV